MEGLNLDEALAETVTLLDECGFSDRASWLADRADVLADPDSTADARQTAKAEVHGVLSGMGGLVDEYLIPRDGSPMSESEANTKRDELAETLHRLTH